MENTDLSGPPNYLGYAFKDQHNVILLLGAACFSAAFATPLPLFAAAGCELLWLVTGPRLGAFRNGIDRRLEADRQAKTDEALDSALAKLPPAYSNRFLMMNRAAEEVLAVATRRRDMPAAALRQAEAGLGKVRATFLEYQLLSRRIAALVEATPALSIEQEAAQLQAAYAADKDLSVRMTIRKAMTQNQRQQQQLQQLTGIARAVELRLSMVEKALAYLKGQVGEAAPSMLSHELDSLLTEVGAASRLEAAVDEAFNAPAPAWPVGT